MSSSVAELLQRRLIFVTGKGGVGKTSVAAALGLTASRLGLRTLVVELGESAEIPALLGKPSTGPQNPPGTPSALGTNLFHLLLIPEIALREYLELQLRVPALVRFALQNSGVKRLLEAAPGWRDLIRLGKLWHLETREQASDPLWDLLIVDAPATGHGLTLLSIPDAVVDTVRAGPLRRHAAGVQALLHDPARCCVVPVTIPEELPTGETLELMEAVGELGLACVPPIANAVHPSVNAEPLTQLLARVDREAAGLPVDNTLQALLDAAVERGKREQACLVALRDRAGINVELPQIEAQADTAHLLQALSARLERAARP